MLSKPPDWSFTKASIVAELSRDGERTVQSGVTALKELGYLTITRERKKKGTIARSVWNVYDSPQMQNAVVDGDKSKSIGGSGLQLRYPAVENAAPTKERVGEAAVPAVKGGAQQQGAYYRDPVTGEWRRKIG